MLHIQIEKLPPAVRDGLASLRTGGTLMLWEGVLPVAALEVFPSAPTLDSQLLDALDKVLAADRKQQRAKPSPRTYGSFPRILGQFVRDEALLSLEEAVRKMTSAPAARLGLRERGTLRDGAIADVVVFDLATVRSTATYDEPRSYPIGIETVIVNGTLVVDDGGHTGATPGRGIRLGKD